jgi:hypothetical protein
MLVVLRAVVIIKSNGRFDDDARYRAAQVHMEDGWIDRMARVASELFQQCRAPTQDAAEQLGQPAATLDKLNDTAA